MVYPGLATGVRMSDYPLLTRAISDLRDYVDTLTKDERAKYFEGEFDFVKHGKTFSLDLSLGDKESSKKALAFLKNVQNEISKYRKDRKTIPVLLRRYLALPDSWKAFVRKRLNPKQAEENDTWLFEMYSIEPNNERYVEMIDNFHKVLCEVEVVL